MSSDYPREPRPAYSELMQPENKHLIPRLKGALIQCNAWLHPQRDTKLTNNSGFSEMAYIKGTVLDADVIMQSHSQRRGKVYLFRMRTLTPEGIFYVSSNTADLRILQLADGTEPPNGKHFRARDLVPALEGMDNASCART